MLYIFCALYPEAEPLISKYKLKKKNYDIKLEVFENEEASIRLILTGVGAINCALAVGVCFTKFHCSSNDFIINFGTCAGVQAGKLILANKLINCPFERVYYPDIIVKNSFPEGTLNSVASSVSEISDESYFDMEAAFLYEALSNYAGPHQMAFLKLVSDNGTTVKVIPTYISDLITRSIDEISIFINHILDYINTLSANEKLSVVQNYSEDTLAADFKCSVTMANKLHQFLVYANAADININPQIERLYQEGLLPVNSKKAGIALLDEFIKNFL